MTTVRHCRAEDFNSVKPLLDDMGQTEHDRERVRARFAELAEHPDHALLLAEGLGRVIGYAWAHDYGPHLRSGKRTARWNDLFVCAEARRAGVGRALFEAIRLWAAGRGVAWLQWQASEGATAFYEQLGLSGDPCPDPGHPFFEIEF